eukprot:CAMPEP_0172531676 /NCGR_PEP_ID=MMETSP1067-20121228/4981_1 /TAXON_ID=265564 ORGANISM="Thalassiosira punctigera, Strain Tpunct2005C2" /NCGR_SAMPLE_ID=MMETSP1067 /ASSEMBLY_ACC=CAM_ASM_000444 /LENGTH=513 /DNA_ID=CAMNT_0013316077 /DNA_START=312 /DNA_END=1851 /DNA_ORIENTATION=-
MMHGGYLIPSRVRKLQNSKRSLQKKVPALSQPSTTNPHSPLHSPGLHDNCPGDAILPGPRFSLRDAEIHDSEYEPTKGNGGELGDATVVYHVDAPPATLSRDSGLVDIALAVGNAIVAGGVYGLVDVACGGPSGSSEGGRKLLQNPFVAGSGIGATVGYFAPNYVYGPVMENLYSLEGISQYFPYIMTLPFATQVSVATGAIAGMLLHPLLYYPMNGVAGVHWGYFSGTALAVVTSALVYVYYGREDTGLPVPVGSFIEPSKIDIVDSVVRYNNVSGEVETYSLKEQKFVGPPDKCLEGRKIAGESRSYARTGKVVFDDRLLAFLYNFFDEDTKTRYPEHILEIKTKRELQQKQDLMALTDASVAVILHDEAYFTGQHDNPARTTSNRGDDVIKIITTIKELISGGKRHLPGFNSLEHVSFAIQLLMVLKQSKQDQSTVDTVPALERFIRKRCPGLTLYTSEEKYNGESVESQLRIAGWNGPELSKAKQRWDQIQRKEIDRTWRNRAFFVATA